MTTETRVPVQNATFDKVDLEKSEWESDKQVDRSAFPAFLEKRVRGDSGILIEFREVVCDAVIAVVENMVFQESLFPLDFRMFVNPVRGKCPGPAVEQSEVRLFVFPAESQQPA